MSALSTGAIGTPEAAQDGADTLVKAPIIARQLGIHRDTLRAWSESGEFPAARKIRNHLYYFRSEVEAWLRQQKEATHAPA